MAEQIVNVVSWTNFMRRLWEIAPNKLSTAKIIVGMTDNMLNTIEGMRTKIEELGLFWPEMSLKQWERDFDRVKKRYAPMRIAMATDPTDATATLVATQILYPTSWTQEDGVQRTSVLMNDIGSLYNQMLVQFAHHQELFGQYGPDITVLDWLTEAKHEVAENAAPGEKPTMRDEVEKAASHVGQFLETVAEAASTTLEWLPWIVGGAVGIAALVALGYAASHLRRPVRNPRRLRRAA
jgi:hypothetical protein